MTKKHFTGLVISNVLTFFICVVIGLYSLQNKEQLTRFTKITENRLNDLETRIKATTIAINDIRTSECFKKYPTHLDSLVKANYIDKHTAKPSTYKHSTYCVARTKSGKSCSRKADKGSSYCWQHR